MPNIYADFDFLNFFILSFRAIFCQSDHSFSGRWYADR